MSEPTLAMSFQDLCIRVAEYAGIAYYGAAQNEAAQLPSDTHDLDLVKRIVNDGWRKFVGSMPNWNWMTPAISVTFNADGNGTQNVTDAKYDTIPAAARYHMPDGFYGHLFTNFTYGPSGPRLTIEPASEDHIRQLYAASGSTTGDPYLFAVRPLPSTAATTNPSSKWEAVFYPAPDSSETVTARGRVWVNKLVENDDRHAAGFQHDEAVLASCLKEWEYQREGKSGNKAEEFAEALRRSVQIDMGSAPRKLGYNGDRSDAGSVGGRSYTGVDTYTNADGTTHSF